MKKQISIIFAFLLIVILTSKEVRAERIYIGKDATYTSGGVTINIKDTDTGLTTTAFLKISRSNTLSWSELVDKGPSTWYCRLEIEGDNNHNLRLNQSTVTTQEDRWNDCIAMNFSLSYTQHENYQFKQRTFGQALSHYMEFNYYNHTSYENTPATVPQGLVDKNTERTVNLGVSAIEAGLLTEWGNHYLTRNASVTLEYERPSYTVTFLDGDGNVFEQQNVLRGDKAETPVNPTKEGYYFGGWDKSFLNVKENITISPKWVSKDGSNPPIAGDDALSVHADLHDEAQIFYVPNIDTELINPNIE